jgi:hypothetical protein
MFPEPLLYPGRDSMDRRTLIVAVLSVRTSFKDKREEPAKNLPPDTVQWWLAPDASWRIKTFALDHDIHIYRLDGGDATEFIANTKRNYGPIIRSLHTIELPDFNDPAVVAQAFHEAGLRNNLEISARGFAFWNPDKARYHTQSEPISEPQSTS